MRKPARHAYKLRQDLELFVSTLPDHHAAHARTLLRAYQGVEEQVVDVLTAANHKEKVSEYVSKLSSAYIDFNISSLPPERRSQSQSVKKIFAELYGELGIQI